MTGGTGCDGVAGDDTGGTDGCETGGGLHGVAQWPIGSS